MGNKIPVRITDTTLRDAHQSSFATRMRTEDMLPIAEQLDNAGFYSLEVWGGATFDVTTRFLNEDPWDRLRTIKKYCPKTPLQMLLRAQNLVGYRNYADDVVKAFVQYSAECGMDIFRVFDAVNDPRNCEASFKEVKAVGKHVQATLCYSLTQRKLGGPVFNIDYFVNKAKIFVDMGADSLCVKDMAGLIAPDDAFALITALKKAVNVPVQLHCHYTSGMASMSYLKAIEAGVDVVDTCLAPFALRSSQPAIEPLVVALEGTDRDTGLNLETLFAMGEHLENVAPKYRDFVDTSKMSIIDTGVLVHQIPGGMTTNLVSQLKEANALDRLKEVYAELPQTRKDLGYPPLVTPTSQIVGVQAVLNVLFGRYKMISGQVKDYCYGLYGRSPAPMNPEVQKICLKGYARGETPITGRAADILDPEMEKAKADTRDIARNPGDVLIYALYPTTGMQFLRIKYGLEPPPPAMKPKTLEQVKREDELMAKARAGKLVEKVEKVAPAKGPGVRTFNVFVDDEYYKVEVEGPDASGSRQSRDEGSAPFPVSAAPTIVRTAAQAPASAPKPAPAAAPAAPAGAMAEGETALVAPMPGMVIRYDVNVGDKVTAGQVLAILEAMKMQNALPSPCEGTIKEIKCAAGASVGRNDVLLVIC